MRNPEIHDQGWSGRRLLNAFGTLLGLIGLVWVVAPLIRDASELGTGVNLGPLVGAVLIMVPVYSAATTMLALAWWWATGLEGERPSAIEGSALWLRSQVVKYLPGNVFHYLGRHLLGRAMGLSHAALVLASFLEFIGLSLAALSLGSAVLLGSENPAPLLRLVVAAILVLAFLFAAPPVLNRIGSVASFSTRRFAVLFFPAFGLHFLFLITTGLLLALIVGIGWPDAAIGWGRPIGIYALAWVLGTFTPGTPGGLGVREAVIAGSLADELGTPDAGLAALSLRAVTMGGEALAAGAAYLVGHR